MKFCTHCGKQLMDEAVFCTGCGCAAGVANNSTPVQHAAPAAQKYCTHCGKQLMDGSVFCTNCGCASGATNNNTSFQNSALATQDKASAAWIILSILIPLCGIIFWVTKKNETPNAAKTCGIVALCSWIVGFFFSFVLMFL